MISLSLVSLAVLWMAALYRYPALFTARKSPRLAQNTAYLGENWIEVLPDPEHHSVPEMQEVC